MHCISIPPREWVPSFVDPSRSLSHKREQEGAQEREGFINDRLSISLRPTNQSRFFLRPPTFSFFSLMPSIVVIVAVEWGQKRGVYYKKWKEWRRDGSIRYILISKESVAVVVLWKSFTLRNHSSYPLVSTIGKENTQTQRMSLWYSSSNTVPS